jgi:hypothetical protein
VSVGLGFSAAGAQTERRLVSALDLTPLALPPELARLTGSWKGRPIVLTARAYSGARVGYARFVDIIGGDLEILNVLALPRPRHPAPMLGADLVGLGKDTAIVVCDLSPVPGATEAPLSAAGLARLQALDLPRGELPAWCQPWFSQQALCTRVAPARAESASTALQLYAERFVELARTAPAADGEREVAEWQGRYCAAHRNDDRGLTLLYKLFERTLAERFLREVLFPERMLG